MHTCPECGQACSCFGDFDDMMHPANSRWAAQCRHVEFDPVCREESDEADYPYRPTEEGK